MFLQRKEKNCKLKALFFELTIIINFFNLVVVTFITCN